MRSSQWLVWSGFAMLALLLYGMTLGAPVVGDDVRFVADNASLDLPLPLFLKDLFSLSYFQYTREATYQPLVTLLHWFTHSRPWLYRLLGILAHALNAYLLFRLGQRLSFRVGLAAGVLFLLFPAHTEALNISAFKGHVLGFACVLGCLLCWLDWLEQKSGCRQALAECCGLFVLGLLCKETTLVALGLMVVYGWGGKLRPQMRGLAWLGCAAVAYVWFRFFLLVPPAAAEYVPRSMPHAPTILGWCLKMLVFPFPLCRERVLADSVWWGLAVVPYLGALWLARKDGVLRFGLLWMGVAALPFLRLAPDVARNPVADRYLYLMAGGFCLVLARLAAENQWRRWLFV
ncbi:MAG: hypothetical protein PHU21_11905, partial [Elusimicrobia bacterium]|nr:hypothetical protein [Elusimicrobiota bacterium]